MYRGFIRLWRKIEENELWTEKREFSKFEAWLDLLLQARYTEKPQKTLLGTKIIYCKKGECLKSIETWAMRWGWHRSKVQRFLILLKELNMIRTQNELKTIRISIVNYETYNNVRIDNELIMNQSRTDNELIASTEEERKENNKVNIKDITPVDSHLPEYQEMKKIAKEILIHMNKIGNKNLQEIGTNLSTIIDRLREGFIKEQFIQIIETKIHDPLLPINNFRPQTLFRDKEKMWKYLEETPEGYIQPKDRKKSGMIESDDQNWDKEPDLIIQTGEENDD
ncbi:conserved phage C-terminal domain-containing protein [Candidatus Latescibacterota bacterium]